ncbi:hypothetical protein FB192DRAFT_1341697 [Mucor lusitanicus]|uniref:Uncharacterized protein n=1 Tax=Mucor circinelloides f. lusitanicus TaxID=29924 RepID=A0A8H4F593_MUCCL|nr:hypothetical protein FB192DRAFT_1341697 [Mucor lusitanicus]
MKFKCYIFFPQIAEDNRSNNIPYQRLAADQRQAFYEELLLPSLKSAINSPTFNRFPKSYHHASVIRSQYLPYNLSHEDVGSTVETMRTSIEQQPDRFKDFKDFYFVMASFGGKTKAASFEEIQNSINNNINLSWLRTNNIECMVDIGYDLNMHTDENLTMLFMDNTAIGTPFKRLRSRLTSSVLKPFGRITSFPLACSNLNGGFKWIPSSNASPKVKKVIGYNVGLHSQFSKLKNNKNEFKPKDLAKTSSAEIANM